METTVMARVGENEITLETGKLAKQADGSVLAKCGNNMVLVTVVSSTNESKMDFFPLSVEYQEKFYSSGKIPGGYFKREGRPSENAILNCRLIDRPLRPMFPEGYRQETQIVATVLSTDGMFPVDMLASLGASAALTVSDIPFNGPIAAVRVVRKDEKFIANPTLSQLEDTDLDLVIAGSRNGILMVEGESTFVKEDVLLEALKFGHQSILPLIDAQMELREKSGNVPKRAFTVRELDAEFVKSVEVFLTPKMQSALSIREKKERYRAFDELKNEAKEKFIQDSENQEELSKDLSDVFSNLKYQMARNMILKDKVRIDGRDTATVRPISCEVGILPRSHGSALFTRGETQVLGTVTLGTGDDEQFIETLHGTKKKQFLLHYNFPPFSVGETGRFGQSRREIGHGFLAEKSLTAILPEFTDFPYTIRVVSEVLESNGSSSMGTVCSGLLALLDAGIPVKHNVAGIAMGLIKEEGNVAILSDILGDEDHLGDMDFKVAGTREGITAFQMDIKIDSVNFEIMEQALNQAKEGRIHILNEMEKVLLKPREEISEYAPRIESIQIKPDKVREVIGAGGKTIKEIIAETGVKIDIEDSGRINIASSDPEASQKAIDMIEAICAEPEAGKTYTGTVKKILDFGAIVEILPNSEGLLHISEIAHQRVRSVEDFVKEGDRVDVKVLDVDRMGKIKLSRKALLEN